MPLGDPKHQLILGELVDVLGERYVHDDPAIVECYRREEQSPSFTTPMNPEFVVFPDGPEDIRQIVQLANRYKFPYSVSSTGTLTGYCAALKPYWVWIDPKRMNRLTIDAKNMYAIVEPYVTHAQVSVEARKVGLINGNPNAGAQTSCLANTIALGTQTSSFRTGRAGRNLLGSESVLPNGDILRTGTLATSEGDFSWGEGPGPDLRGFLRGHIGHLGSLGIVTKLAVKLYPWPGPSVLPTEGAAPVKKCVLPDDKVRWYSIRYANPLDGVEALREIGKAEVGTYVGLYSPTFLAEHYPTSRENHWRDWNDGWFHKHFKYVVQVGTVAVASKKQLDYEEKVLTQIAQETGGVFVDHDAHDAWVTRVAARNVVDALSARTQRLPRGLPTKPGGGPVYDSLSDAYRNIPPYDDLSLWIAPLDLCHFAFCSASAESEPGEKSVAHEKRMMQRAMAEGPEAVAKGIAGSFVIGGNVERSAPAYGSNIHRVVAAIKSALDPDNLANPGRMIDMDALARSAQMPREQASPGNDY